MHGNSLMRTLLAGALLLAGTLSAGAADKICVTIEGSIQGNFPGEHSSAQCQGQIEALESHHLVDADSGGNLQHRTVIFTKPIDTATLPLWRAADTRESLEVTFSYYRTATGGTSYVHQTVLLGGAVVAAVEPYVPDNWDPVLSTLVPTERIRLHYAQMTVTYEPTGGTVTLVNPTP